MPAEINRLNRLQNRLRSALVDIYMREFNKQAPRGKMRQAREIITLAVRRAEAHIPDYPASFMINGTLFRHKLTRFLVAKTPQEKLDFIRSQIFERRPELASKVLEVEGRLKAGEKVPKKTREAVRARIYDLRAGNTSRDWGIQANVLSEWGYVFPVALVAAFPLLGLEREGFPQLSWPDPQQAVRNIRYRLKAHRPDLFREIEWAEKHLSKKGEIDKRRLNILRQNLLSLTWEDLTEYRLGGLVHCQFFHSIEEVLRAAFPDLNLTKAVYFAGGYDLTDRADVRELIAEVLKRMKLGGVEELNTGDRQVKRKFKFLNGQRVSWGNILLRFERVIFKQAWQIGQRYAQEKLTTTEALQAIIDLIINEEPAKQNLTANLHHWLKVIGYLNESIIWLNCPLVRKYGWQIFEDYFGMPWQTYIKSHLFWDAHPTI